MKLFPVTGGIFESRPGTCSEDPVVAVIDQNSIWNYGSVEQVWARDLGVLRVLLFNQVRIYFDVTVNLKV